MRAGRPRKSTSSALAEVLPPPQLQTERSAPSLRERATSCASIVEGEVSVMMLYPFLFQAKGLRTRIAAGGLERCALLCYPLSILTGLKRCKGSGIESLSPAHLRQQAALIRLML